MRNAFLLAALTLFLTTACSKDPAEQYKFTPEQLAWQPYSAGQTLRFGHAKDNKVRTYRITEVQDRLEKQYTGGSWLPFPSKPSPLCQHVTVLAERTDSTIYVPRYVSATVRDSVSYSMPVIDLELYLESGSPLTLHATCDWQRVFYTSLPLEEVTSGLPITATNAELLPSITLGAITYLETLGVSLNFTPAPLPRTKPIRRLYYAKNVGVVGFEEDGTGLWYRL